MRTGNKRFIIVAMGSIALLGFAAYFISLNGEFIWDDIAFVKDNTLIRTWSNAPRVFSVDISRSLAPGGGGVKYNFYRPLQMLTLMVDYSLWGLRPIGYRLTNLIFHILAALALFWLVLILFDNRLFALLTAALFTVHPVHTEAVAFISGRADSMALLFMLLTFISYLKGRHFFTICLYVLALLSRENSIILPFLIFLYLYLFDKKIKKLPFFALVFTAFIYAALRSIMAHELLAGTNIPSFTGAFQRIPGFFAALVNYVRILVLPIELHMEYGNPIFLFKDPKVLLGMVLCALLLVYGIGKRKSARVVSFAVFWFVLSLLPSSNIYPIGAYMAEHWLYMPSIGFFLLVARWVLSLHSYKTGVFLAVSLLGFYSILTVRQTDYWKELIPFYERTLAFNPESPRLLNNLAVAYHNNKEYEKAIETYEKAIEIDPTYFETFCNLGTVYHDVKEYRKAEEAYGREIAINPTYPKVYNNLGALYNDTGRYRKAIEAYKKAIGLKPGQMETYFNLGLAYQNVGKYKESIAAYKKAIGLKPDYPNAYNDIGVTYHKAGRLEEAVWAYKKALELDPENIVIQNNLKMVQELQERGRGEAYP
jgi:Flp pilus assembly protein TadD